MAKHRYSKGLLVSTLVFFAGVTLWGVWQVETYTPRALMIDTEGQPTIGYPASKVHVVVFEEPKCPHCKLFQTMVFPTIKKKYIETNKVLYTVIPVSFMANSMPAAISLVCVYLQDPKHPNSDLFFSYLDTMYKLQPPEQTDWAKVERLDAIAKRASEAIQIERMNLCLQSKTHQNVVTRNTDYGRILLGGQITTPLVYVNGVRVPKSNLRGVEKSIRRALVREGVQP